MRYVAASYKHLVLGLVFLKYVSDAFATQRARLEARTREQGGDWLTDDADERDAILELATSTHPTTSSGSRADHRLRPTRNRPRTLTAGSVAGPA
jgi:hypothetical protein